MNKIETFEQFLTSGSVSINYGSFILALVLAAVLAYILGKIYVKYGSSISNRTKFAHNFVLLGMTTTLIIMIVKSSLALSLGLVGALSIVRFRAAIKEPEELAYLFLVIAIGLGLGANQILLTLIAYIIIIFAIIIKQVTKRRKDEQNMNLIVSTNHPNKLKLKNMVEIVSKYCSEARLKRFDTSENSVEASFYVSVKKFRSIELIQRDLKKQSDDVSVTYLDVN